LAGGVVGVAHRIVGYHRHCRPLWGVNGNISENIYRHHVCCRTVDGSSFVGVGLCFDIGLARLHAGLREEREMKFKIDWLNVFFAAFMAVVMFLLVMNFVHTHRMGGLSQENEILTDTVILQSAMIKDMYETMHAAWDFEYSGRTQGMAKQWYDTWGDETREE
jgi:hypothetical protein